SFESALSRESAFVLNNWGLVSIATFIAIATLWPRISEWLLNQKSTLGPTFYNMWIPPIALIVFGLMGVAPLLGWRKTSPELFKKSFKWPLVTMGVAVLSFVLIGPRLGFPVFYKADPIYLGDLGRALAKMASAYPLIALALVAFNCAVVVQEFVRGVKARQAAHKGESSLHSVFLLVGKARRRYGGYIVHVGIAVMFIGFLGRAWGVD